MSHRKTEFRPSLLTMPIQGTDSAPVPEATIDDIQTEYHPHSGRKSHIEHFDDYGRKEESTRNDFIPPKKPWRPFRTRLDFEVADLIMETAMNAKQIVTLISLLQRCALSVEKFTIHSHNDLQKTWDQSSTKSVAVIGFLLHALLCILILISKFEQRDIAVPHKTGTRSYKTYHQSFWDWALGHVDHPWLIQHFVWDAEKISKYNGSRWV